jgi:hypothetical protein
MKPIWEGIKKRLTVTAAIGSISLALGLVAGIVGVGRGKDIAGIPDEFYANTSTD